MARRRTRGPWFGRKKLRRMYAKRREAGRTAGDFATRADGSRIFVPDGVIKHVKTSSRYCALPVRGRSGFVVIDTTRRRAIGHSWPDLMSLRTCSDSLSGARKRRAR